MAGLATAALAGLAAWLALAAPAHAQEPVGPGEGERVEVVDARFPAMVVADRPFYDVQVTLHNKEAEEHRVLLFTTLYLGEGSGPCEGNRSDHAVSKFQKSVRLPAQATHTVDGTAERWAHEANSTNLPADGPYEVCVWVRLAQCPEGQPLGACFLDFHPASLNVRLANTPPRLEVGASPLRGTVDTTYAFTATARDAEGDPYTLAWDFGDLTVGEGPRVTHRFARAGSYDVKVVADDGWDQAEGSVVVNVGPAGSDVRPEEPTRIPAVGVGLWLAAVGALALAFASRRRR